MVTVFVIGVMQIFLRFVANAKLLILGTENHFDCRSIILMETREIIVEKI